jgi:hypothetical protein
VRRDLFGDCLAEPGEQSRLYLEAAIEGDLWSSLRGDGKLRIESLLLGKDRQNRLPLGGVAPLRLAASRLMASPSFLAAVPNGNLSLGKGRWSGTLSLEAGGRRLRGASAGAVTQVDIEELLRCFTSVDKALFGRGEIPQYRLSFAGTGADQLRASLAAAGSVRLTEGRIAMFDLVGTIRQHIQKLLGGDEAAAGQTDFATFESRFEIRDEKLHLSDLRLASASIETTGGGHVTFARELNLDAVAVLRKDLVPTVVGKFLPGRAGSKVPLRVRGTTDKPKVRPDLGRMMKESVGYLLR